MSDSAEITPQLDPGIIPQLRKARMAHRNAILALHEAKAVVKKTEQVIEDILREVDAGKALVNGRDAPLLDAIERKQASPEPTASDGNSTATGEVTWTSIDLEQVLRAACFLDHRLIDDPHAGIWTDVKQVGCDDRKILEILRAIWPMSARFLPDPAPGCTIQGGSTCRFWMGSRRPKDQQPTLAGLELADRIRRVLGIPRAHVDTSPTVEKLFDPPTKPSTKPRKMTRRSGRQKRQDALRGETT